MSNYDCIELTFSQLITVRFWYLPKTRKLRKLSWFFYTIFHFFYTIFQWTISFPVCLNPFWNVRVISWDSGEVDCGHFDFPTLTCFSSSFGFNKTGKTSFFSYGLAKGDRLLSEGIASQSTMKTTLIKRKSLFKMWNCLERSVVTHVYKVLPWKKS